MAPRKPAPVEEPTPVDEQPPVEETPQDAPVEEAPQGTGADPDAAPPADDVPVFAPDEPPSPEEQPFVSSIPDWLEDNYRELVSDPNRNDSFTALADRSTGALAAWARHEAKLRGEDITPTDATPAGADATRSADEQ